MTKAAAPDDPTDTAPTGLCRIYRAGCAADLDRRARHRHHAARARGDQRRSRRAQAHRRALHRQRLLPRHGRWPAHRRAAGRQFRAQAGDLCRLRRLCARLPGLGLHRELGDHAGGAGASGLRRRRAAHRHCRHGARRIRRPGDGADHVDRHGRLHHRAGCRPGAGPGPDPAGRLAVDLCRAGGAGAGGRGLVCPAAERDPGPRGQAGVSAGRYRRRPARDPADPGGAGLYADRRADVRHVRRLPRRRAADLSGCLRRRRALCRLFRPRLHRARGGGDRQCLAGDAARDAPAHRAGAGGADRPLLWLLGASAALWRSAPDATVYPLAAFGVFLRRHYLRQSQRAGAGTAGPYGGPRRGLCRLARHLSVAAPGSGDQRPHQWHGDPADRRLCRARARRLLRHVLDEPRPPGLSPCRRELGVPEPLGKGLAPLGSPRQNSARSPAAPPKSDRPAVAQSGQHAGGALLSVRLFATGYGQPDRGAAGSWNETTWCRPKSGPRKRRATRFMPVRSATRSTKSPRCPKTPSRSVTAAAM
uniref:Uncharacterized protein n=1 Tax=uncultured Rhodobacterales bacterium HF4000_03E16 TaxID=710785 RepID=E0XV78_9RHOB|nr:hypothetical protein [uncultured Rhodobacterales bacterium HF4000_03E16]